MGLFKPKTTLVLDKPLPSVDKELVALAAERKAEGGLSFADCFMVAVAQKMKAAIGTVDPGFKVLRNEVEFVWL